MKSCVLFIEWENVFYPISAIYAALEPAWNKGPRSSFIFLKMGQNEFPAQETVNISFGPLPVRQ